MSRQEHANGRMFPVAASAPEGRNKKLWTNSHLDDKGYFFTLMPHLQLAMKEDFLHFIWRFQYFDKKDLKATSGELINILHPGFANDDAGPDFSDAKVVINDIHWHGHVEIHLCSADWNHHHHHHDPTYDNVILHVVWEDNKLIHRNDGSPIPTLELKHKIDASLKDRYEQLVETPLKVPCASSIQDVGNIVRLSMLEKALMDRLSKRCRTIHKLLVLRNNDWEETAYALLAKNFGFKVNSEPFLRLSEVLPLKILLKHRNSLLSIEALLFGQAGFLDQPIKEPYFETLKEEYLFLSKKYQLYDNRLSLVQWKFMRLRPANFPTFRIAQFAMLIFRRGSLFSMLLSIENPKTLLDALELKLCDYWQNHVNFGKTSAHKFSGTGKESINNIIINSAAPLQAAYGKYIDRQSLVDNAVNLLQQTPAEKNNITKMWKGLGLAIEHAFDSQGSIELYNNYCIPRKCLDCTIGAHIIKKGPWA